jgi:hypothetical protein
VRLNDSQRNLSTRKIRQRYIRDEQINGSVVVVDKLQSFNASSRFRHVAQRLKYYSEGAYVARVVFYDQKGLHISPPDPTIWTPQMNAPSTTLCISATERWADSQMVRVEMSYLARGLIRGLTDSASACRWCSHIAHYVR